MQTTKEILDDFKSHRNCKLSASLIAEDISHIKNLLSYCLKEKYPYSQYSSWLLCHVTINYQELILQFHHQAIDVFLECREPSIKRNLCNVLSKLPKIEYREGELLETYFDIVSDSNSKVALKVYAMYQIVPFTIEFPSLKNELKSIIENKIVTESPAFKAAGKKVLKLISSKN